MMLKRCFKCGVEKGLDDFYRHPAMGDGRLGKCKECTKLDAKEARLKKIDYYREYDRSRGNRQRKGFHTERRPENIGKYKAKAKLNYAVKNGYIKRLPCEVCGASPAHGHHDDYSFPLSVRWLCPAHHQQWHAKHGEAPNGGPKET